MPYQVDSTGLSRDPSVGERYRTDPQVLSRVSVRLGLELIAAGDWVLQHAGDLSLPTLIMQGAADRIVSPTAAREFASAAPQDLITYQEWEGGYHELHNDVIQEEVLNYLLSWVEARLA
jgi:alpha-beta hydrolase superfamily lysophospholipase